MDVKLKFVSLLKTKQNNKENSDISNAGEKLPERRNQGGLQKDWEMQLADSQRIVQTDRLIVRLIEKQPIHQKHQPRVSNN
jgi:hypothetical protein